MHLCYFPCHHQQYEMQYAPFEGIISGIVLAMISSSCILDT